MSLLYNPKQSHFKSSLLLKGEMFLHFLSMSCNATVDGAVLPDSALQHT